MSDFLSDSLPDSGASIDREHLERMTMGDAGLAAEVLRLFDTQAATLVSKMRQSDLESLKALAHALKGSARGIGAWHVATAAEAVERDGPDYGVNLDRLGSAVEAVRADIAEILAA